MDQVLEQWLIGRKKKGRLKTQEIKYLENKKNFLDELKNICHSF